MSAQSNTSWLPILAHFSTDHDEIWDGFEAVPVEHPDTPCEWDLMKQGK